MRRHTITVTLKDRDVHNWLIATLRFHARSGYLKEVASGIYMLSTPEGPETDASVKRLDARLIRLIGLLERRRRRERGKRRGATETTTRERRG